MLNTATFLSRALRRLGSDRAGGVAMIFALGLPVVAGGLAAAVDFSTWYAAKARLQNAVDEAALASAAEMQLATTQPGQIARVAETHVRTSLAAKGPDPSDIRAEPDQKGRTVEVIVSAEVSPIFSRFLYDGLRLIQARAVARLSNTAPVCVIGLDTRMAGTLHFEKKAQLTAQGCAVFSNSTDRKSLQGEDGAVAVSALFCSSGGFEKNRATFLPGPVTDCPPVKDPLASRAQPSVGACIENDKVVQKATTTLIPGTYCGGLKITDKSVVTLAPGIYVIKDGPLIVDKKSSIQGQNVGLFFMGDKASLLFDKDSVVDLTAPKDGAMAGLLMSEQRAVANPAPAPQPTDGLVSGVVGVVNELLPPLPLGAPKMREYRIISDEARNLLGTIYLPSGRLMIDSKKDVADRSAYTVIVVRRLDLFDGPNLYLNSNYAASDIPVPEGVGPVRGNIVLSQ